jgi:endonuclease/exonuclease/phosphatase family metal-dependent hydrolase
MKLRIGTFNAENLFARFKFDTKLSSREVQRLLASGWQGESTLFEPFDPIERKLTADAITGIDADVLGLQEIESLPTLKRFNEQFLSKLGYKYQMLIDGNDMRGIDVAVLSRYPFAYMRTNQFDRQPDGKPLFSRDCLEVGITLPGNKTLPVFINHFKSMSGGRDKTTPQRQRQARRVAEILETRFGPQPGEKNWVVLGDLNDYQPGEALTALLGKPYLENPLLRLPEAERWTHYYDAEDTYHQLDYILLPKKLAAATRALPVIERRGVTTKAEKVTVERFPNVDAGRKASDHCPWAIDLEI